MSPFKSAGSSSPKQCLLGCRGLAIWGLPGLSQKGYHISDRFPCGWTYSSSSEPASPFSFLLVYPLITLKAMKSKSRKLLIAPFSFVEQKTVRTSAGAARKFRAYLAWGAWNPRLSSSHLMELPPSRDVSLILILLLFKLLCIWGYSLS